MKRWYYIYRFHRDAQHLSIFDAIRLACWDYKWILDKERKP